MRLSVAIVALFVASNAALAQSYQQNLTTLTRGLPSEIRDFIDRRANCNHWSGEYPYDADRKAQIASALNNLRCNALAADEKTLMQRYANNGAVLQALAVSRTWLPG